MNEKERRLRFLFLVDAVHALEMARWSISAAGGSVVRRGNLLRKIKLLTDEIEDLIWVSFVGDDLPISGPVIRSSPKGPESEIEWE